MKICAPASMAWMVLLAMPMSIHSSESKFDTERLYFEGNSGSLADPWGLAGFERAIDKARNYETYCKISLAEALIESLKDETPSHVSEQGRRVILPQGKTQTPVAEQNPSTDRCLDVKAGCAARALEKLLNFELPKLYAENESEKPRSKQLAAVAEEATRQLNAYRTGVAEALSKKEPSLADVKKKYEGKIITDLTQSAAEARPSIEHLAALFEEWCPIGKKLSDIESIAGPTMEFEGRPCYNFRYGNDGLGVKFVIKKDVIVAVIWIAGRD